MRKVVYIASFLLLVSHYLSGQCDSSAVKRSLQIMNRDTFYTLRYEAFKNIDTCFPALIEKNNNTSMPLPEIFAVYPPDSSFVLYSYRFRNHSAMYSYRAFLVKGNDIIVLERDSVQKFNISKDSIYSPNNWYGSVYYNLIEKKHQGKSYYFLFGFRDLDAYENQKLIDVMWFDDEGKLKLGGKFFDLPQFKDAQRYFFNYGEMGAAKLNFDPYQKMIIKDHLIYRSVNGRPTKLPDGSYEAFEWKKNTWHYIEKVYDQVLEEAPRPVPIKRESKDIFGNEKSKN